MTAALAPAENRLIEESFFQLDDAGLGISLSDLANTIQVWSILHVQATREVATVGKAAEILHVSPDLVAKVVSEHPWMFLSGREDDRTQQIIEHEGE